MFLEITNSCMYLLALLSGNICDKEFDICAYYRFFRCDFVRDLIPIWLYSTLCMSVIYLLRIMIDRWHRYDVMHDACNYGGLHLFKHVDVGCKTLNMKCCLGGFTVNIYRYKAIGADATSSVILYTCKCMLSGNPLAPVGNPIGAKGLPIGAKGFPDRG